MDKVNADKIRFLHYLNQFFAGIGGEEQADSDLMDFEGSCGPGDQIKENLSGQGEIVGTLVCGDDFFAKNTEKILSEIIRLVKEYRPDVLIAGPAFNAGRYGFACGIICKIVNEKLGIPTITSMYPENPGVEICKKTTYIIPSGATSLDMKIVLPVISRLALKLGKKEEIGPAKLEGYIPTGKRKNIIAEAPGYKRAINMLLCKLEGKPFETELPLPNYSSSVVLAPQVEAMGDSLVAFVTTGGIVPKGNPDKIESRRATKWGKYSFEGLSTLTNETFYCIHAGFDSQYVNPDPNRMVPLDVLRELEKEGRIGKLYDYFYSTVGAGGPIERAEVFGKEIALDLKKNGIQAVILSFS